MLSCSDTFASELFSVLKEDHLVLSSDDINGRAFSKELGNLFLCETFNLFLETSNLSDTGNARLNVFVKTMSELFDNRLRVFLFGEDACPHLSETRFDIQEEFDSPSPKKFRGNEDFDLHLSAKEFYGSKTPYSKAFSSKSIDVEAESTKYKEKYMELEHENADIKIKLNVAESKALSFEEDLLRKVEAFSELELKYNALVQDYKKLKDDNNSKSTTSCISRDAQTEYQTIDFRNAACQTKKVLLDSTAFTNIITKIENDPRASAVEKLHNNIRNFNCNVTFKLNADGKQECSVLITKGKHIMTIADSVTFTGVGKSNNEAKESAFLSIINRIREEAEK